MGGEAGETPASAFTGRSTHNDARRGVCSICGARDAYLSGGDEHWFACEKHRLRWRAGSTRSSSRRSSESWTPAAIDRFRSYAACHRNVHLFPAVVPPEVRAAFDDVFEYLWESEHASLECCEHREKHVLTKAYRAMWWLWGVPSEDAVLESDMGNRAGRR